MSGKDENKLHLWDTRDERTERKKHQMGRNCIFHEENGKVQPEARSGKVKKFSIAFLPSFGHHSPPTTTRDFRSY